MLTSTKCAIALWCLWIVGGVFAAVVFHFDYSNNAAATWALLSVVPACAVLFLTLLHHHDVIHHTHNHYSLVLNMGIACLLLAVSFVFTAMHLSIAIENGEAIMSNIQYSDYIVAIWTFITFKNSILMLHHSIKCHKKLTERQRFTISCPAPPAVTDDESLIPS